jgi:alpha-amylase
MVSDMGFDGMYVDGVSKLLHDHTPGHLYRHPYRDLILFPRNFVLSDAIAFGYSDRTWSEWPLTPEKFISLVRKAEGKYVGIGVGYETFGEHKKASEGIFNFLEGIIALAATSDDLALVTLAEATRALPLSDVISTPVTTSWADKEKDLSAWLGNELQKIAFDSLKRLYKIGRSTGNSKLINSYRCLQTSDHFYYISTKGKGDQDVHDFANHYGSPYEAFRNYMNIISDFELEVQRYLEKRYSLVY